MLPKRTHVQVQVVVSILFGSGGNSHHSRTQVRTPPMAGVTQAAMLFAVAEGHINDHEVAERRGFSRVDPPEKKRDTET